MPWEELNHISTFWLLYGAAIFISLGTIYRGLGACCEVRDQVKQCSMANVFLVLIAPAYIFALFLSLTHTFLWDRYRGFLLKRHVHKGLKALGDSQRTVKETSSALRWFHVPLRAYTKDEVYAELKRLKVCDNLPHIKSIDSDLEL